MQLEFAVNRLDFDLRRPLTLLLALVDFEVFLDVLRCFLVGRVGTVLHVLRTAVKEDVDVGLGLVLWVKWVSAGG
jgi:hypothetical protein